MLSQTILENEFSKLMDPNDLLFIGHPATKAGAATNFAAAYDTYAQDAEDASGDTFLLAPVASNFEDALTFNTNTPADMAAEFGAAFLAYWSGVTFSIGSLLNPTTEPCPSVGGTGVWSVEITSVITAITNTGLIAQLTSEFTTLSIDGATKAVDIAAIFHTATTIEVLALISGLDTTPTPSGPLPITNICTIF